jgi:ribonuclease P protein component
MKRNFRLTHTKDFNQLRKEGNTKRHKLAVLVYKKNGLANSRAAFVASKAVGNAVKRNLVKRRMRACIINSWEQINPGWDLILFARAAGTSASYNEWSNAILHLLRQADLIFDSKVNVN